MNLEEYLYDRVLPIIQSWNGKEVYAISFFVYSNEEYVYKGISNYSEFSIGYCIEEECGYAPPLSEERWNIMCYSERQEEEIIIEPDDNDEGAEALFQWYKEMGIENIGYEDNDHIYDEDMNYIGKGPVGYYELLTVVSNVARKLQINKVIEKKFGAIPIIVHELEESWYVKEATIHANPNGEADVFLKALEEDFPRA